MGNSECFLAKEVKTILLRNNKFFFIFMLKDTKIRRPLFSKKQCSEEKLSLYSANTVIKFCGLVVRVYGDIQRPWVRFPALPDFLRISGSRTGSTQPREDY
jgi:hypothetical protein